MAYKFIKLPPWEYIDTEDEVRRLLTDLDRRDDYGIDTEDTGTDRNKDSIIVFGIGWDGDGGRRICIPRKFIEMFEPLFNDTSKQMDFHSANFDTWMLHNSGINIIPSNSTPFRRNDIRHMHALLAELQPHGLKGMSSREEQIWMPGFKESFPGKDPVVTFIKAPISEKADYASKDPWITSRLSKRYQKELEDEYLLEYYMNIEKPMSDVLFDMERSGIKVDTGILKKLEKETSAVLIEIEKKFNAAAGKMVNLNSPKQKREFFIDTLGYKSSKTTKGGKSGAPQKSVDKDVLANWAEEYNCEFSRMAIEYGKIDNLHGTYIVGLLNSADETSRIHAEFTQDKAKTGRLSSVRPNLHNIPRPENDPFKLRRLFIPRDGYCFHVADYSQIEMRVAAHITKDPVLIKSIRDGEDLHSRTASLIYGVSYDEIIKAKKLAKTDAQLTKEQEGYLLMRQNCKTVNFGILYGQGAGGLARELGVDYRQAQGIINRFFGIYRGVSEYYVSIKKQYMVEKSVQTLFGRKRRLMDPSMARNPAEEFRRAINDPIQGSAGDILKIALINLYKERLDKEGISMVLQIHDEIIFETPNDTPPAIIERIGQIMTDSVTLSVPIEIDMGKGPTWLDAKG